MADAGFKIESILVIIWTILLLSLLDCAELLVLTSWSSMGGASSRFP